MACNVCGEKVDVCDNESCLNDLEGDFHCYNGAHFCTVLCWEGYIIKEDRSNLEPAEDDEEAK